MTFEATYLGSNGWLIKFKKTNLIIDPWLKGDLIFPPGEWFFKGSLEEEISIDKKIDIILDSIRKIKGDIDLAWLDLDKAKMTGIYLNVPERDQMNLTVNEQLVVELYSK